MITFDQKEVNAALRRMAGVLSTIPANRRLVLVRDGYLAVTNGDVAVDVECPSLDTDTALLLPAAVLRAGAAACAAVACDPATVARYAAEVDALLARGPAARTLMDLYGLARNVAPFASDDETRYVLNGVFFDGDGHAVATDGSRMAVDHVGTNGVRGIVPRAAFSAFVRTDCTTTIGTDDGYARLRTPDSAAGSVTVVARLIDGRFPDYQRVIPADGAGTRMAATDDLRAVVKAHAGKGRCVGFRPDGSACVFTEGEKGAPAVVHAEFACAPHAGDAVAFNSVYLAEALATFPGDAWVTLPADMYVPLKLHNDRLTHVVMPMRSKVPAAA